MMKKNDLKLKVASTILAGSFMGMFITGCSNDDSVLDGTMLDHTVVVTFSDNSKDIAHPFSTGYNELAYQSVISEVCYYDNDGSDHRNIAYQVYDIENVEQISSYISEEDMELLSNKETKDQAVYQIVSRIIVNTEDNTRTR